MARRRDRARRPGRAAPHLGPLGLLATLACHSTVVSPAELRPPEGARSLVVGVEAGGLVRVSAFDLSAAPDVELPRLESSWADTVVVSARYYRRPLTPLSIPSGPISPDPTGHPVPAQGGVLDVQRIMRGDDDSDWLEGGLGPGFASFRSLEFPPASGCRSFDPELSLDLDGTERIQRAAALGEGALVLQPGRRLYRVLGDAIESLHETLPALVEALPGGWVTVVSLSEGAAALSCDGGQPRMVRLGPDLSLEPITAEGLDACPQELSTWEDRLFALVEGRSVYWLEAGAARWRHLGDFSRAVPHPAGNTSVPFVALGPQRVAGLFIDSPTPLRITYHSMVLTPEAETLETLDVPDTTAFKLSQLAVVSGHLAVMFSDATLGSLLLLRPPAGPWTTPLRIESQVVYALAADGATLLATGRFGFILEALLLRDGETEICPSSPVAPGNYATHLVELGDGRFLLAGNSNAEREEERYENQTVTIARAR